LSKVGGRILAVSLKLSSGVKAAFPDLRVLVSQISSVKVETVNPKLEEFKNLIAEETRRAHTAETLRDRPDLRAYRDFFWQIKVDPTKIRPAAEALIRRIVTGKPLPRINTLVDAYNLASIKTEVAIAAFDADKLRGDLTMRFAEKDEEFLGIGMEKPLRLQGGEIVVQDAEKLVAVYPYRDAEDSKVTEATRNVVLLFCGVPGISQEKLVGAMRVTLDYVTRFCGGTVKV
jgi:DNA/RNA-binding domain of Phe-tRNA-synthetase-like protein